jgi:hypothetical protein
VTKATLVYSGRTTNWPLVGVGIAGFAGLVVMGRPWAGPWPGMAVPLAITLVLAAVGFSTSTSLRVTTGPNGVHVRCGALGWPRFSYPAERIAAVEIVTVTPWKSWDYGLVWTRAGGWNFVLRSGAALRLTLTNGRHATVGVNDPQAAVAALAATKIDTADPEGH